MFLKLFFSLFSHFNLSVNKRNDLPPLTSQRSTILEPAAKGPIKPSIVSSASFFIVIFIAGSEIAEIKTLI